MNTYIWLNCRGEDIVGIGATKADAISKLTPRNRSAILMCDRCVDYSQYPVSGTLKHNQIIKRR